MTDHEEIQALLAEFVSSRLAPEQRSMVEEHLSGCVACGEMMSDLEKIKDAIQQAGEAMFDPHPESAFLRRFARKEGGGSDPRILRHLELCPVCRLEVRTWERMGGAERTAPSAPGPRVPIWWIGLAAAAGVVLGFLVTLQIHPLSMPKVEKLPIPLTPSTTSVGVPPSMRQPVMRFLPGLLRGGDIPTQRWTLDSSEPLIGVVVPISLPLNAPDGQRFRFELGRKGEDPVWAAELTASRIRQHLEASEGVSLVAAPSRSLEPGKYVFSVAPADSPEKTPVYRAEIDVAYRQSPAETNAPQ